MSENAKEPIGGSKWLTITSRSSRGTSEGELFATLPDLPGVNVTGETEGEVLALAKEFADDYVRDLVEDGHPVPKPRSYEQLLKDEPRDKSEMTRAFIPVEVPGKSVKISLSIDEALLARADRAAEDEGLTRSGFIAAAIDTRLRARTAHGSRECIPRPAAASRFGRALSRRARDACRLRAADVDREYRGSVGRCNSGQARKA